MSADATSPLRWLRALSVALGCLLASCGTYEDKRIRELLHEKGFGTRATGDATVENYIGGRDAVQFLFQPDAGLLLASPRLVELSVPQPIALDGTVFVPYVGPVYVLGKTETEAAALVTQQLRAQGILTPEIQARIQWPSDKSFYAIGEVAVKGPKPMQADLTLYDAMFMVGWTPLANIGRVYVIRPDAQHPLVVDVNFREMLATGLTTANIALRERDTIYVPPTFLGMVARLLQRLLEPLGVAVQAAFGLAQARTSYDILKGDANGFYFRY